MAVKCELTDRRDGGDDFTQLELVQDGGLSGGVKTDHQDSHLLATPESIEQPRESDTHGGGVSKPTWTDKIEMSAMVGRSSSGRCKAEGKRGTRTCCGLLCQGWSWWAFNEPQQARKGIGWRLAGSHTTYRSRKQREREVWCVEGERAGGREGESLIVGDGMYEGREEKDRLVSGFLERKKEGVFFLYTDTRE